MEHKIITEIIDSIFIITLNAPPVNALDQSLRRNIAAALDEAENKNGVQAVLFLSNLKLFCGGADIKEFNNNQFWAEPNLPDLLNRLDAFPKITMSAIGGASLGGGLELTLATDYRIPTRQAVFALPEVHLGIMPGAGGTQRLCRIISIKNAIKMILTGNNINANEAFDYGLIDQIIDDQSSFKLKAIAHLQNLITQKTSKISKYQQSVEFQQSDFDLIEKEIIALKQKRQWNENKIHALESMALGLKKSIEIGLEKEKTLFSELLLSNESKAMRHIFFAARAALNIPDIDKQIKPLKIKRIAIIGAGKMGSDIAINFLLHSFFVQLIDINKASLNQALSKISDQLHKYALKNKLNKEYALSCLAHLSLKENYDTAAQADLIIEAVFEDIHLKKSIFKSLNDYIDQNTIVASNTSSLDINSLAASSKYPKNVVGLHFFSPAHIMPLVEVIRSNHTAKEVIQTAITLSKQIKKQPVVVKQSYGFVGNRMFEPYLREAGRLLLEGASVEQIDQALCDFGMAMGPLETADLIGSDICYMMRKQIADEVQSFDQSYYAIQNRLYAQGDLGKKSGVGFYLYQHKKRTNNEAIDQLTDELSQQLKIKKRVITNDEILQRCLYALINEAINIMDEKIAYRASDCDFIAVKGYGFPVWKGGPLFYAEQIGLKRLLETIELYRTELKEYGAFWFKPSPLLIKLVKENRSLSSLI